MKKVLALSAIMIMIFVVGLYAKGMGIGNGYGKANNTQSYSHLTSDNKTVFAESMIEQLPYEDLSAEEETALVFMRQEEKLARDVYLKLYENWGLSVFLNIAESEQTHMDMLAILLKKYNIADPVIDENITGNFGDNTFQKLYDNFVTNGSFDITGALEVGAEIEELDISDLNSKLESVENIDIITVLSSLRQGSENHLRSFVRLLSNYGLEYYPKELDTDYFQEIMNNNNGKGMGRKNTGFNTLSENCTKYVLPE